MKPMIWVALGYNIPVNPSKNRVYVWRKLKEFGAEYFKQGVAILPQSPQNLTKLTGVATRIREMGGDATLVEMRYLELRDETEMVARFQKQSVTEYQDLLRDCACLLSDIRQNLQEAEGHDHLKKMMKRYGKVKSRDYFRSRSREDIAEGLEELAKDMAHLSDGIGNQLSGMLDL